MLSVKKKYILLCAAWPFQLLKSALTVEKHRTITPASPSPYHSWFQALDIPSAVCFWGWRALSLFSNSSNRSLLIALAIFIFTEWCNLYPPVSFCCYFPCTISYSTSSFQVQQRGWRCSFMLRIYLEWIYIVQIVTFLGFFFRFVLFLIIANIQFQLGFWVLFLSPMGAQNSELHCLIQSQNHKTAWVEMDHNDHPVSPPLQCARSPTTNSWMTITSSASLCIYVPSTSHLHHWVSFLQFFVLFTTTAFVF